MEENSEAPTLRASEAGLHSLARELDGVVPPRTLLVTPHLRENALSSTEARSFKIHEMSQMFHMLDEYMFKDRFLFELYA